MKTYTLTGRDGRRYASAVPGAWGGHRKTKIYGRLDCPAALRAITRGGYVGHRVFFADEQTAIAAGYRPCGACCRDRYLAWRDRDAGMLGDVRFRWLTIFLDFPAGAFWPGIAFWREVTRSGLSPLRGEAGDSATLLPQAGDAYLRVQRVRAGSGGCHLDLHVDGSLSGAADRAVGLGAAVRHTEEGLIVADSPGGFTFCLVDWEGEAAVPDPVRLHPAALGDAGASRADQLCLDIPAADYERECSFWSALSGYELRATVRPEFSILTRAEGIPVRLLLQRRDHAEPGERVTGHVDFACEDRQRLAAAHTAAGARIVAGYPRWTVLADPTGRQYCLTDRDPRTGTLAR